MGGRGTFAVGRQVDYTYEQVGKIEGVKIINPIDKSKALKLPEESHSSNSYVLYDHKEHNYYYYVTLQEVLTLLTYQLDL